MDREDMTLIVGPDDYAACPECGVRLDPDTDGDDLREIDLDDNGPVYLGICMDHGAFRFQIAESEPLKPCPFCNSPASFHDGEDEDGRFVAVQCDGCGCGSGKHYPIMDDARPNAANEWNRRDGDKIKLNALRAEIRQLRQRYGKPA